MSRKFPGASPRSLLGLAFFELPWWQLGTQTLSALDLDLLCLS